MMARLARITVSGVAQAVDLARGYIPPALGGTLIPGNFQGYHPAGSPYSAYTGMWGKYLAQNDQLQATSSMRVYPGTFPNGMVFTWDITRDPDWGGVEGYLHIDYGNYDESPGTITPRQVDAITTLTASIGWTTTGNASSGLLSECWLTSAAAPSGTLAKTHEVAFFPRVSASAASYLAGLPTVGAGSFTDANGVTWNVRVDAGTNPQPYLIAYRPGYVDFQGALPYRDYLTFLKTSGKITGSEWFNGLALGVEPFDGAGSLTVSQFTVTYN